MYMPLLEGCNQQMLLHFTNDEIFILTENITAICNFKREAF
jgi:hypothetical protein